MATPLGAMRVELELDSSKFASSLTASKKAVNYFKAEARALDGAMKNNGNTMTLLSAKQKTLTQALEKQGSVLTKLKTNFDTLEVGSKKWENAATEIERENAKLEQLRNELGRVQDALIKVHAENSRWGKVGSALTGFGEGTKKVGTVLTNMGNAMRPVSTILSAGFSLATKKALDFGGQMQTVKALLGDTITDSKKLDETTLQLGNSSKKWSKQFGITTTEINTGMQEIIKAGLDANQTMGAMPPILTASKATGEDFNTVMSASTSIMSQFGLITTDTTQMLKNTNRVTDSLSFVANKTKAGFSDMGLAMEYVGPVANSVGMDLEETAAAIGILSNAGIDGQKAGTALRGALSKLLDPSKENAAAFEKLGFSAEEFRSGAIKLPDVIDRIKKNTEDMTDAQKASLIAQAFGIEAQSGINALVNEGADSLRKLATETKNAEGYTDKLYKKMSGSGKSAVDRFKSSLEVLQVTIGEKLLPILAPIIEKVTKWVENFAEADESTQKFWMTIAGGLAVAYPLLNFTGNVVSAIGSVSSAFGTLATKISTILAKRAITSTLSSVATSATATGTAMAGATGKAGLLTSAIGLLGNPLTWGVLLGGSAVVAASLWADEANKAAQRTAEWGTAVSNTEANELSRFKSKVDETNHAIELFGTKGVQDVENIKKAFSELTGEIAKLVDENLTKDLELAEKLGLTEEEIQRIKDNANQTKKATDSMASDIVDIYKRANEQKRKLSDEEKQIVLSAQNALINEQLDLMKFSSKEKEAITKAMNGRLEELNSTQLAKALSNTMTMIEEENKAYKSRKKDIERLYEEEKITKETYHREIEQLEAEHSAKMGVYSEKYMDMQKRLLEVNGSLAKSTPEAQKLILNQVKQTMESLGLSYKEFEAKMEGTAQKASETSSLVGEYWQGMSEDARAAVNYWNGIVLDPVTGEVKTNAREEIQKALHAEGGWEAIRLSLKEGKMTTTAKIAIGDALVASGQWEQLRPEEKALVVDGQPAIKAIVESKDNLAIWNAMPESVKKLLGENDKFMSSAETATETLNRWNFLQPYQKDLIVNDLATGKTEQAQLAINNLIGKTVGLDADDLPVLQKVISTNTAINGLKQTSIPTMNAIDGTSAEVAKANASVNSPKQNAPIQMFGLDSTGLAVAQTSASVNSPKQFQPINMFAQNNTAGPVAQATQDVNSPRQFSPAVINATNYASAEARQATWDLNSIPRSITSTITTFVQKIFSNEKGTDFHPGGLAMVNDQKGSMYKELVTLPTGESFIPEGRDVILPLPRGSKVLPANKTKRLMAKMGIPRYAEGVGYSKDSQIFKTMDRIEKQYSTDVTINTDNSAIIQFLKEILQILKQGKLYDQPITVNVASESGTDYNRLAEKVGNLLALEIQRKSQLRGG
ncbi:tail protein, phage assocaited [Streptococcus varani]|uniref:Tail protein, phage assocaited n=1 Tax=Streptococcus varani TaxID=1608583 RepID=A0A0E4H4E1_9STRE|nr:phage tail tape measure protein [Streptococcus varani]CQR24574.1 tail protein, phage assocaited [Streptococcus varani]